VKFQHHTYDEGGRWRVPPPEWSRDRTRADYWMRTAFEPEEWVSLAEHAAQAGLLFLCSTFSVRSAQLMEPLLPAWKVASGQVTNGPMLDYMAAHPKPTIVSAGMAAGSEMGAALRRFREVVRLHSVSLYPTPLECVGLGELAHDEMGYYKGFAYGLSDHSGTIWPSLAAATMGAAMVEVHVTFSREAYGPDTASSITIEELRLLCEGIEAIRKAQQPVDREALLAGPLAEARRVYMGVA
jgi:N,N'-diacetyllegionaminate synthase